MQALVLAGGEGTRLRPLTLTVPKPVMPLAGRPFLAHMLDWLARHGVADVILSCGFMADGVERVLGSEHRGLPLRYVQEETPLGTAGPVRLASDEGLLRDRVLVLNGDVLTDFDLSAEVEFHERRGAAATLALVAVDDPSSYGLVPTADDGRVEGFLEKEAAGSANGGAGTSRVNAGAYVLEREAVDAIPAGRPASFEREVFPTLVGRGLYGFPLEGYWCDIGTPERYLGATRDLLAGRVESSLPPRDETGSLVLDGAEVDGARIGPLSVVGEGCRVGEGSTVERSVLHERAAVGEGCRVLESVVGEGAVVGDGAEVGPGALLGSGAEVATGARVGPGARAEPGERVA